MIDGVIAALEGGADGAVPLLAVADTLKRNDDGKWTTVPRDGLHRAQTPQGFRFTKILRAHRHYAAQDVTDDMALAELAGLHIARGRGRRREHEGHDAAKISRSPKRICARGWARAAPAWAMTCIGFAPGDHVWLCGIKVPHDHALEGHSDADAGLHALTDAILGAIGEGDIGQHFPPSDERWRGAPSWKFLDHAASLVRDKGGAIVHCDVTIICERPKVGPHREAMRARIAEILKLDVSRVSVKATTTEGPWLRRPARRSRRTGGGHRAAAVKIILLKPGDEELLARAESVFNSECPLAGALRHAAARADLRHGRGADRRQ